MTIVVVAFVVVAIIGPYKDYATAYEFATTNLGFVAVINGLNRGPTAPLKELTMK